MTEIPWKITWERNAKGLYEKHGRHRSYAAKDDGARHLAWLYRICKNAHDVGYGDLFAQALDEFFDAGVNVLQPKPPEPLKAPESIKDVFGNALPNPFQTGDLQGQTILIQHDPQIAEFYKALAKSPWQGWKAWEDEKARIEKARAFRYNSDAHRANVFVEANKASETAKAKFVADHPDLVERCRWEAAPVTFPIKGTPSFNLTTAGKIARNPIIKPLFAEMERMEAEHIAAAKKSAEQARQAAESELRRLEAVA